MIEMVIDATLALSHVDGIKILTSCLPMLIVVVSSYFLGFSQGRRERDESDDIRRP